MESRRVESCRVVWSCVESCVKSCRVESCRVESCRDESCRAELTEVHGLRLKHLNESDLISPFCELFVLSKNILLCGDNRLS